jgi:hypothetical protein
LTRQVVDGVHGCLASEGGVGAVMVVEVQPAVKGSHSFGFGSVDADVAPFVEERPVEAFDFAVGLGR